MKRLWIVSLGVFAVAVTPAAAQDIPCEKPTEPITISATYEEQLFEYVNCRFDRLYDTFYVPCNTPSAPPPIGPSTAERAANYAYCESLNAQDRASKQEESLAAVASRLDTVEASVAASQQVAEPLAPSPAVAPANEVTTLRWTVVALAVVVLLLAAAQVSGLLLRRRNRP